MLMYQGALLRSLRKPDASAPDCRPFQEFSTSGLPRGEQFQGFRSAFKGVMDIAAPAGEPDAFPAGFKVWNLDCLAFMRTRLPGRHRPHRRRHVKNGALDHWYIDLAYGVANRGDLPQRTSELPQLHCLATPLEATVEHDGLLTLFIPPDLFASSLSLYPIPDVTFEGGAGRLLADYLFVLDRSMDELLASEMPHIVAATRSLFAACLSPTRDRLAEAQPPIDATLLVRARRLVDTRLQDRDLTPEMLCASLGVSRSRLYRLFEPLGGIASYIRKQRLMRTRDALCDIDDGRSVARIAEQWGFVDASAYSRTFRQEFGVSPKEARDLAWAAEGLVSGRDFPERTGTPQSLYQLLRAVSGR